MEEKQVKKALPSVNIQGKQYVQVHERLLYFNETYPEGSIITQLVSSTNGNIVIKAKVTPDMGKPERYFTGYSQATVGVGLVNKTAALENAETSAVGRALGFMGIGIIESVASADEVNKAVSAAQKVAPAAAAIVAPAPTSSGSLATLKQVGMIQSLITEKKLDKDLIYSEHGITSSKELTIKQASDLIGELLKIATPQETPPAESAPAPMDETVEIPEDVTAGW